MHVHIQNYQCLADVALNIEGLTAIVGSNNSGKSAVMRALRGPFQNTGGDSFVRHGEKFCAVTWTFDDGRIVTWEKGKGRNRYELDGGEENGGKTLKKVGKTVPDEVVALGVRPIEAGGKPFWPQIAEQTYGQIFLVDKSGSTIAEAVADVERVGKLNDALRLCESDRRKANDTLRLRREDRDRLEAEFAGFDGLDAVASQVEDLEALYLTTKKVRKAVVHTIGLRDRKLEAERALSLLAPIREVEIPDTETVDEVVEALEALERVQGFKERLEACRGTVEALQGIDSVVVPDASDEAVVQDIVDSLEAIGRCKQNLDRAQAQVQHWTEAGRVASQINLGEAAEAIAQKAMRGIDKFGSLKQRYAEAKGVVETLESRLADLQQELVEAEAEVDEAQAALKVCPTCGQPLDHEHTEGP